MSSKKSGLISNFLMLTGIGLIAGALFWWYQTFGLRMDYVKCLAMESGICRLSSLSGLFGGSQYNPLILWVGLGCLGVGYIFKKLGMF